jgi:hypothetical protein
MEPTAAATIRLAAAVGATPYSDARTRYDLAQHDTTVVPDVTQPGEADRTEMSVASIRGWDLPGPGAGSLEYREDVTRQDRIEQATGQAISALRVSRDRACVVDAPVANGRAIFELYEKLHKQDYGILLSPDRRQIIVFSFKPGSFDIELAIVLDAPLAGLAAAPDGTGNSRMMLTDGGARFINDVIPGVPVVKLTRAALLAGIDRPATMHFDNTLIEPVVERLS